MQTNTKQTSIVTAGKDFQLFNKIKMSHSYVCGLIPTFSYVRRSSNDPKLVCVGAELTGIHHFLNKSAPGLGGYHVGGVGIYPEEALIKALGESHERYSQLIAELITDCPFIFDSHQNLKASGASLLDEEKIHVFSPEQYAREGFPFKKYHVSQKLGWYRLNSMFTDTPPMWIPGQMLFAGYNVRTAMGEPWIHAAVTTGTATHSDKDSAILGALLELLQLDVAMGNWYSNRQAKRLLFDERLIGLTRLLSEYAPTYKNHLTFHLLESPEDWSCFSVACVYQNTTGRMPVVVVGLGSDISLEKAMYKAFLESYGIILMSRYELFHFNENLFDKSACYDIDSNVCFYAKGLANDTIQYKFPKDLCVKASQIKSDIEGDSSVQINSLLQELSYYKKGIYLCELTTPESKEIDFVTYRAWSPDLLPLCFPSAPWSNHSRFESYGGIDDAYQPHPYP